MYNVTIHKTDTGYVVAKDSVWLPGVYDSATTARKAAQFADGWIQSIWDILLTRDGLKAVITMEDLFETNI